MYACIFYVDTRTGLKLDLRNDINFGIDFACKIPKCVYVCECMCAGECVHLMEINFMPL